MLIISSAVTSHGQGTFGNLDFESANVPSLPPHQGGLVSALDGLPGWNVYGGTAQGEVFHNGVSLGGAAISIMGPQFDSSLILQGQFTAYLAGDFNGPNSVAIGQTGQIPAIALSLRFLTSPGAIFQVTFGGVSLPVTEVFRNSKFSIVGADISGFAGQTGELRFIAPPSGGGFLDLITFSQVPIPEPCCLTLVALGAVVMLLRLLKVRLYDSV